MSVGCPSFNGSKGMEAEKIDGKIEEELEELRRRVAELEEGRDGRLGDPHKEAGYYFRKLVENAHDLILVLNRDGSIRYVSPSAKRITGYEPEELMHENPFDFVHQDDLECLWEKFTTGLDEPGKVERVTYRSRRRDGSWFVAEAVATNLLHDPYVEGIVVNIRDITAFRRVEEELRKSEQMYRLLVENLNHVIFTVDTDGTLVYISPAIERMSGFKVEELVGQPLVRFVHPEDIPGVVGSFRRTLGGALEPYEFRVMDKGGNLRFVQTSSRPYEENGKVAGLIGLMSEITEQVQAEEARRRSEESFRSMIRKNIHYHRGT